MSPGKCKYSDSCHAAKEVVQMDGISDRHPCRRLHERMLDSVDGGLTRVQANCDRGCGLARSRSLCVVLLAA